MRVGPYDIEQTDFAGFRVRRGNVVVKESWCIASCTNFVVNALLMEDELMNRHREAFDAQRAIYHTAQHGTGV